MGRYDEVMCARGAGATDRARRRRRVVLFCVCWRRALFVPTLVELFFRASENAPFASWDARRGGYARFVHEKNSFDRETRV